MMACSGWLPIMRCRRWRAAIWRVLDKTACDIVVCGAVPPDRALRRDGAHAGDAIYVSGRLGGSALGLQKKNRARRGNVICVRNPGSRWASSCVKRWAPSRPWI